MVKCLLFVAQRGDGIETSGLPRRPHAEDHADRQAEEHGDDEGDRAEGEAPPGDGSDHRRGPQADDDADEPAEQGQDEGLDEELEQDVAAFAPMALRIPISRVRSRTDTSMMFMIPIPPTTSEIEAIPARSTVSSPVIELTVVSNWA